MQRLCSIVALKHDWILQWTNLIRVSWLLLEPLLGYVVPVCQFKFSLRDAEPSCLLLYVARGGGRGEEGGGEEIERWREGGGEEREKR